MLNQHESLSLPNDPKPVADKLDEKITISEKEAARRYAYSIHWFRRARWMGNGPPFIKVGRRIMYVLKEIDAWFKQHRRYQSTSEYSHTK